MHEQCLGLTERGHEITLFTSRPRTNDGGAPSMPYKIVRLGNRWTTYLEIAAYIRRRLPSGSFDVTLEHINGVPWCSPLWSDCPTLGYLYHVVGRTFFEEIPFPLSLLGWASERSIPLVYRNTQMAALGAGAKGEFVKLGVTPESIAVINPGLDHRTFYPIGSKSKAPTILMVGPIKRYKRFDVALQAIKLLRETLPEVSLTIIGKDSGGLQRQLIQYASSLGISSMVSFLGFVQESEKARLMSSSWCVVYSSEREGWGLGTAEAASCGTPSIVADIPGLRDGVIPDRTGFQFHSNDPTDLAKKLATLLGDDTLRGQFSRAAIEFAGQFDWSRHVTEVERLLKGVARE
jgi:glycosyltransferase involved in cell wall biosynthesis